jgi:hypothetical protein
MVVEPSHVKQLSLNHVCKIGLSKGAPPVSPTPAANFSTSFACVVDTGGKFATGVNDSGHKFATGVNETGHKFATDFNGVDGKLPPISTTPTANLPPV